MLSCFFVLCFCLVFLIVVKRIHSGSFKKASLRKESVEDGRTEGIEKGRGLRLRLINIVFLFFSFVFFYLNKIKLTMALHCKCNMSLKA